MINKLNVTTNKWLGGAILDMFFLTPQIYRLY